VILACSLLIVVFCAVTFAGDIVLFNFEGANRRIFNARQGICCCLQKAARCGPPSVAARAEKLVFAAAVKTAVSTDNCPVSPT